MRFLYSVVSSICMGVHLISTSWGNEENKLKQTEGKHKALTADHNALAPVLPIII